MKQQKRTNDNHSKTKGTILDQLNLESSMIQRGRERYLERQTGLKNLAISKTHGRFMDDAVVGVSQALTDIQKDIESKPEHLQRPEWFYVIQELDHDLLSYLALSTMMEAVGQNWTRAKTLIRIGMRIEMEFYSIQLKAFDKDLYKRLEKDAFKRHSNVGYRKQYISTVAHKEGFEYEWWSNIKRTKFSQPLFNAVLSGCDIFEEWMSTRDGKDTAYIGFTDRMNNELAEADYLESWSHPLMMPTVTEPIGWSGLDGGVYMDPALAKFTPLVRKSNALQRALIRKGIDDGSFQPVLDSINAIQRTPYTINEYVLEAVEWAWSEGLTPNDGFPSAVKKAPVEFPENYDDLSVEEKKRYRLMATETKKYNRKVDSDVTNMMTDVSAAREMMQFDRFWLPHNFDWRGRVYPIPTFNHHREDHVRSMFLLANTKPLDQEGAKWIAFQVANAGDFTTEDGRRVSKMSFEDRIAWTLKNQEWILECGRDFRSTYDRWSKADKPFAFLAGARELYHYVEKGEGNHYSGLPVNLDGSNSGTQHYAAMGLNENDGRLVNLIPTELPEDIYEAVATVVKESMALDTSPEAREWEAFGISRKVVKRPTMTFNYSATKIGFKQQVIDDTINPVKREITLGLRDELPWSDTTAAARCLADHMWDAVNKVVQGAGEGMEFFKSIASVMSDHGLPVVWKTPIGFPVVNLYHPDTIRRVKLFLYDRDHKQLKERKSNIAIDDKKKLNRRKINSAIAPNVIHSLDSSHLLSTVMNNLHKGVKDFVLIHDSFATTPADTWTMFHAVRESFINQYDNRCVYSEILESAKKKLPVEAHDQLPQVPSKGALNLAGIRTSWFCFS